MNKDERFDVVYEPAEEITPLSNEEIVDEDSVYIVDPVDIEAYAEDHAQFSEQHDLENYQDEADELEVQNWHAIPSHGSVEEDEALGEDLLVDISSADTLLHPTEGQIISAARAYAPSELDALNRPSNWKHAAKIVAHAFTPRKILQKKESLSSESLDLRSIAQRVAGTTHITFTGTATKFNPARILAKPLASYHLVVTIAIILTIFGLIMVQSASSVKAITTVGSAYSMFTLQVIFVAIGLVLFAVSLRVRMEWLRQMSLLSLIVTIVLLILVLVPGVGLEVNSARRWFSIFGLSLQPSELVKVTLCVWGSHLLASRQFKNANFQELLFPLMPVAALISILIILEPSLSTMIIIVIIVSSLLWFAGLPLRIFAFIGAIAVVLIGLLSLSAGYRAQRVMSFLGLIHSDMGANYQSLQAHYALASGGIFGLGLGQSKSKWNYLPNEYNDFIFAVVGEELGFIGAVFLVLLFVGLTFIGIRITLRSVDPYLRLLAGSISCLISGQALINIGYVVGILPVTGVQLPLISAGGTSALTNLVLLGLLANIARHEPEAILTLSTKQRPRRMFALPVPKPYKPNAVEKRRLKVQREKLIGKRVEVPIYAKRSTHKDYAKTEEHHPSRNARDASRYPDTASRRPNMRYREPDFFAHESRSLRTHPRTGMERDRDYVSYPASKSVHAPQRTSSKNTKPKKTESGQKSRPRTPAGSARRGSL